MFDALRQRGFDIMVRNHAEALLSVDFPVETQELISALTEVSMDASELIASGGGEALSTQRMRRRLSQAGWHKHNFRIETTVDGIAIGDGTSHEIDHVRRGAARQEPWRWKSNGTTRIRFLTVIWKIFIGCMRNRSSAPGSS